MNSSPPPHKGLIIKRKLPHNESWRGRRTSSKTKKNLSQVKFTAITNNQQINSQSILISLAHSIIKYFATSLTHTSTEREKENIKIEGKSTIDVAEVEGKLENYF